MVIHTCPTCQKQFNKKSTYVDHIENKKKPCQPNNIKIFQNIPNCPENIPNYSKNNKNDTNDDKLDNKLIKSNKVDNKNITCKMCLKNFSTNYNLNKHLKQSCKVIKLENKKKENIYNNLVENEEYKLKVDLIQKENEEYKKKVDLLLKQNEELNNKIADILKKNTQNITNNTQNIVQNINITPVKLNPFGKENLKSIKNDDFIKIITDTSNTGRFCLNRLIDIIHFNNKMPENQNIYMPDYNRKKFMFYNGDDWQLTQDEENVIFQVMEHVRSLFNINNNEELEERLENDKKFNTKFYATFKKYYDWVFDETDDIYLNKQELEKKNNFKAMMSREVINKLYNNRDKVKKNFDKLENIVKNNLLENN